MIDMIGNEKNVKNACCCVETLMECLFGRVGLLEGGKSLWPYQNSKWYDFPTSKLIPNIEPKYNSKYNKIQQEGRPSWNIEILTAGRTEKYSENAAENTA